VGRWPLALAVPAALPSACLGGRWMALLPLGLGGYRRPLLAGFLRSWWPGAGLAGRRVPVSAGRCPCLRPGR